MDATLPSRRRDRHAARPQRSLAPYAGREYFPDGPLPIAAPLVWSRDERPGAPRRTTPGAAPHPALSPDLRHAVVAAIAYTLWERRGGGAIDNWLEAERVLEAILGGRSFTAP